MDNAWTSLLHGRGYAYIQIIFSDSILLFFLLSSHNLVKRDKPKNIQIPGDKRDTSEKSASEVKRYMELKREQRILKYE